MDVSLDKKHENRVEFSVKGVTPYFANMIRRYSIARVPVLALERVTIYENTSAFWDEYIGHRIGLMPIITPEKLSKSAEYMFYLDFEGPGIAYSKDLKSDDKHVKIAKDNIPIITLGEKQRIKLEGKTSLDTCARHGRYQAGLVGYGLDDKGTAQFFVESFYHMEPAELIERGCDVILEEIEGFQKDLKAK